MIPRGQTMEPDQDDRPPVVPWEQFYRQIDWRQGEHVGLIGPTGCGKTTLGFYLLPLRKYVAAIATKPASASIDRFYQENHYKILKKWNGKLSTTEYPHRLLWPQQKTMGDVQGQYDAIRDALHAIFTQGGWCVYLDELKYVTKKLSLDREVDTLWLQGRELKISLMAGTQRPAWVPLEMYDQSTHLFFWQERDDRNLSRISGISSMDTVIIRKTIINLEPHQFLYLNTRNGQMLRCTAPNPNGGR